MGGIVQGYAYPNVVLDGGVGGPSVSVRDLWEVYPGLASGEPSDFARDVVKAAEWSRGHDKFHGLRDRFEDAAIHTVAEMGLFGDDNEEEEEK